MTTTQTSEEKAMKSSTTIVNITLTNTTEFPPGGYSYFEPSINFRVPNDIAMLGLSDVARALQMARAQNPTSGLNPDYQACLQAVKAYTCARLNNDPRYCNSLTPITVDNSKPRSGPRPCAGCGRR